MKAKDYFAKYEQALASDNSDECSTAIAEMLNEMNSEVQNLLKVRNVKTDAGTFPIFKEMNQKWNAIVRLFEKKYGATPIVKDGFQLYWVRKMPQLMGKI